eukprot:scaffold478_cov63-Cyclotella_meneghiniana.AAC.6
MECLCDGLTNTMNDKGPSLFQRIQPTVILSVEYQSNKSRKQRAGLPVAKPTTIESDGSRWV